MCIAIPVFNAFIRAYKAHERAPLDGVPITQAKGKNVKEAVVSGKGKLDRIGNARYPHIKPMTVKQFLSKGDS